eukprot:2187020-Pleurochrysis_carterae.AAC.1
MTTSAATNKCEFGYTTPSGRELSWGPSKFTLYAEFHRRTLKVKINTARTYHTVRGALTLNEQAKWCELCAWAHGKDCEKLRAYRAEEARRTQELLDKARREKAPTRAQQQAARPEYTLDVEQEKQVGSMTPHKVIHRRGVHTVGKHVRLLHAGAGGVAAQDLRGGGEGSRRSARRTEGGADHGADADGLQGFQDAPGQLPLHASEMQVLPLQPPQTRDKGASQGPRARRRTKGAHAGMAAGWQRTGRRGSGTELGRGTKRQGQWRHGRMVRRLEEDRKAGNRWGKRREDKKTLEVDTHRTHTAPCSILCAIHGAIRTGIGRACDIHRRHAAPDKHVARTAAHCPIHDAIYGATQTWTNMAHIEADHDTHTRTCKAWALQHTWKWMLMCCICIVWFTNFGKRDVRAASKTEKNGQRERETRKARRQRRLREQRRWTQTCIRKWQSTRKLTYDGKNRRKYRSK